MVNRSEEQQVTVEIAEVEPRAIKATADSLTVGAVIFDAFGGQHKITNVRRRKGGLTTTREDGWVDSWELDEIVTFIPSPKSH